MHVQLETFIPLVFSIIDDALLKAMPQCWCIQVVNFLEAEALLNFYTHLVNHWVHIWVLEPQA